MKRGILKTMNLLAQNTWRKFKVNRDSVLCSLKMYKISQLKQHNFEFDLSTDINSFIASKDTYQKFYFYSSSSYLFLINYQNLEA